jgi:hypothetical protein
LAAASSAAHLHEHEGRASACLHSSLQLITTNLQAILHALANTLTSTSMKSLPEVHTLPSSKPKLHTASNSPACLCH